MEVLNTRIHDVKIIKPRIFGDARGFFLETFEKQRYSEMLDIQLDFVQDNYSRSGRHVRVDCIISEHARRANWSASFAVKCLMLRWISALRHRHLVSGMP